MLDFIIVGAGPVGISCAIVCNKAGLSYVLIDKGCLVNSIYHYPLQMHFFSTSDKLEIGGIPFMSLMPKPTRNEALEYYRLVCKHWDINPMLYEEVKNITKKEDLFIVKTSKNVLQARAVIVCTGFYDSPHKMNIEGENLSHVFHYFREAHPYLYSKIAVIGSGNSAVDIALELYRKNCKVTLITEEKEISNRVKYWVKPEIDNRIKESKIKAFFDAKVEKISPSCVEIISANKPYSIEADFVFAMTGYEPNFSALTRWGIHVSKHHEIEFSSSTLETNVKNLYVAGVIKGGLITNEWFIENTRNDGEIIVNHFLKQKNNHGT